MGRTPAVLIVAAEAREAVVAARDCFERSQCALLRANDELRTATAIFDKEVAKVQGVPIEDYPQVYWDAMERRDNRLLKIYDADEARMVAEEDLHSALDAEVEAASEAASVKMRTGNRQSARRAAAEYMTM